MRFFIRILLGIVLLIVILALAMNIRARSQRGTEADYHKNLPKNLVLETSKIGIDSTLAPECTCKGEEKSPDLYWRPNRMDVPPDPNIKSYALTVTDPDVPSPAFPLFNLTHWVIYDIPSTFGSLPFGLPIEQAIRHTAQFGKNSMGDQKYIGPCPPVGKHAYIFRIYGLNTRLMPNAPLDKQGLLDAMKGHVLGFGELKTYYAAE